MSGSQQVMLMRSSGGGGGGGPPDLTYLFSTVSTTGSHVISSSAQGGDVAIISCSAVFRSGDTYWTGGVSGFTYIKAVNSGVGLANIYGYLAFKVLTAGDIGATLTNLPRSGPTGGPQASVIAYYRPSKPVATVEDAGLGGQQATTSAPTSQSVALLTDNDPAYVAYASYITNNNIPTRGSGITMNETTGVSISGHRHFFRHKELNDGATLSNFSVTMTDGGTNIMQSGALRVK